VKGNNAPLEPIAAIDLYTYELPTCKVCPIMLGRVQRLPNETEHARLDPTKLFIFFKKKVSFPKLVLNFVFETSIFKSCYMLFPKLIICYMMGPVQHTRPV
jgi:hypothetical protein